MKAVVCKKFGPPTELLVEERPSPQPGDNDIVVDVQASGVGFVDGLMVQGLYQVKPPLPYYPGAEFAGTVSQLGSRVQSSQNGLQVGDRVMGLAGQGAFAEQVCLPARRVVKISPQLPMTIAAGFYINYATALYGLRDCGALQAGENILILGASGGVGSAAICVAKAMGARVIAGASSQPKRDAASRFGADATIDYTQDNWRNTLKDIAGEQGINLVYDPVGGDLADPAFRTLSPGGRFLVVGFASGTIPKLALNLALLKRSAVVGVDWGGESRANPDINKELMTTLMKWVDSGQLKPAPVATRPISEVREALTDQLNGQVVGKLVLEHPAT